MLRLSGLAGVIFFQELGMNNFPKRCIAIHMHSIANYTHQDSSCKHILSMYHNHWDTTHIFLLSHLNHHRIEHQ